MESSGVSSFVRSILSHDRLMVHTYDTEIEINLIQEIKKLKKLKLN